MQKILIKTLRITGNAPPDERRSNIQATPEPTSAVLIICILHHAFSAHLFYCTFVQLPVFTLHYAAPFFAVADHRDQDPPVAYYPLKDVATYLSRSRCQCS